VSLKDQEIGYPERCGACSRKHTYKTKDISSWNVGLTKDSDERMTTSSMNMRQHYAEHGHHSAGKTKENDENVRLKAIKISVSKRGVPHSLKQREAHVGRHLISQEEASQRFANLGFTLLDQYSGAMKHVRVICNMCNDISEKKLHVLEHGSRCHSCFPPEVSRWQYEITEFVKSLINEVQINDRRVINPYELDIYVPSKGFAIECNGIYWHSDAIDQHGFDHAEKKRLRAKAAGIRLLTLFEDEWRDKRYIVESMIRHRLGVVSSTAARKLTLQRCLPANVAQQLQDWHLEGYVNSSYALRLVTSEGETIGACSLRWARGTNRKTLEVARIAFQPNTHIQGGVGKFIKEAKTWARELGAVQLLSYSDNRLGDGLGYAACGMQFDGLTVPRFWWTDFVQRIDRFKYRADKARGLTERQVAQEARVHRIYGCSNTRWVSST
jgi:hypothetical protein